MTRIVKENVEVERMIDEVKETNAAAMGIYSIVDCCF